MVPQIAARAEGRAQRIRAGVLAWFAVVAAAWLVTYRLEANGVAHALHHHTIYHSGQILAGGLALLGVWLVMTVAMMLPGALPAVLRNSHTGSRLVFIAVYAVAWTGFGAAAFVGDMGLHALVHGWPVATRFEGLIPVSVLAAAAVYQLTPWKRASLRACRSTADQRATLHRAIDYSRHCLVSGWALMFVMFAAGVADLAWMAALALVMTAEKVLPSSDGFRQAAALVLALFAIGTLLGGRFL